MGIIMIFSSVLFSAALHIHRHAVTSCKSPSRLSAVSLATSGIQEGNNLSFSFDSDGLPFVINNPATCIICNDRMQFVDDLQAERLSVETTHRSASTDYVGTISLTITTNNGDRMQRHIPDAIYDPNSPFSILGIPFFGKFLGREDVPYPTSNNDGIYIQSSASYSHFVWGHGKHEHHFMHDDQCLPILHLNTGLNYYQAFCSCVKQSYKDAVHFEFSLAHLIISDDVATPLHSCKGVPQAVTPDTDFVLGQDVLYTDGEGNQERVVYKGATPDSQWHTL
jgi:hypothetical protein